MSKSQKVATAVASTVSTPTVESVAELAFNATCGGMDAADKARALWGAEFPTLKANSVEREQFNAGVLAAWMKKNEQRVPKVVRKMGEYRLLGADEVADESTVTALTPAFVMQYKGNALTKLKKDTPTLGAIVEKRKLYYQGVYADTWRNLCESLARLIKREAEPVSGTPNRTAPFAERLPKYVERIVTANTAAFNRGETGAYDPAKMDRALAAFAKALKE